MNMTQFLSPKNDGFIFACNSLLILRFNENNKIMMQKFSPPLTKRLHSMAMQLQSQRSTLKQRQCKLVLPRRKEMIELLSQNHKPSTLLSSCQANFKMRLPSCVEESLPATTVLWHNESMRRGPELDRSLVRFPFCYPMYSPRNSNSNSLSKSIFKF